MLNTCPTMKTVQVHSTIPLIGSYFLIVSETYELVQSFLFNFSVISFFFF